MLLFVIEMSLTFSDEKKACS